MHGIFTEISLVIVLAGAIGIIMHLLKQPSLVGYVITGLIVGPLGYMHLNNAAVLDSLSEIGITLLLFMVGLELTLKDIKKTGWTVVFAGIFQIAAMTAIGTSLFVFLGLPLRASLYIGLGIGISSTIIAVKLLSEKKELNSLHGKFVLGILIVEDLISILALTVITGFAGQQVASLETVLLVLLKMIILFALAIFASTHLFPRIVDKLSSSSELMFLFALAWGLGFATLISDGLFGLTPEIGGFLAGLTLANTSAHIHISNRMKPLRDFFLILFFIVLGSKLVIGNLPAMLSVAMIIVSLGIIIKPLFTFIFLTRMGHASRTSFLTATSLAHISEFSIILAVLGWKAGHLSEGILSLMTLSTILSFLTASFIIKHNQSIYERTKGFWKWWEKKRSEKETDGLEKNLKNHIVLVGAHRTGFSILHSLEKMPKRFVVVDFDPDVVRKLRENEIDAVFGDIADPEILDEINIEEAKMIISTVPDYQDNLGLVNIAKQAKKRIKIVVSAANDMEARKLYEKGADYVLIPQFLSGLQLAQMLEKNIGLRAINKLKKRDLKLLDSKL